MPIWGLCSGQHVLSCVVGYLRRYDVWEFSSGFDRSISETDLVDRDFIIGFDVLVLPDVSFKD